MKPGGDRPLSLSLAVFSVVLCALLEHSDGVVPRRSRSRSRLSLQEKMRRSHYPSYLEEWSHKALYRPSTTLAPSSPVKRHFRATVTRCCKIGEKTARKRLSCSADEQAVSRKKNRIHQTKLELLTPGKGENSFTDILILRIAKCSASKYVGNFEKCCLYRQEFIKEMENCRSYQGQLRRKCRQNVRKNYP